jgi:hypothetical protein
VRRSLGKAKLFTIGLTVLVPLAACGSGTSDSRSESISQDTFSGTWPFTVSSGELRCEGSDGFGSVIFSANGSEYGVNGTALDAGFQRINAIWKDDPSGITPRVSISDVLEQGLALCK